MAQSIEDLETQESPEQDEVTEEFTEDAPAQEPVPEDQGTSGQGQLYSASTKSAPYSEGETVEGELRVDPGKDLDGAIDLYGEEFVYDLYDSQFKQKVQNAIRQRLTDGVRPEEIPEVMADYRPDQVTRRSKSPAETAEKNFDQLSEEDQIAFLERLQQKVG